MDDLAWNWQEDDFSPKPYAPPLSTDGQGEIAVFQSAASSAESAGSTTASHSPASSTPSSASPTSGGEGCCEHGSPASPSTTTAGPWRLTEEQKQPCHYEEHSEEVWPVEANALTFFAEASRSCARTCPSPGDAPGSPVSVPASSTNTPGSLSLFDPDGFSSRTYPDCSVRTAVGTSESCL